jgi:flagellar biosynthetic protein FliQ
MEVIDVLAIGRDALMTTVMLAGPLLLLVLLVGLLIGLFQAATSIQEMTLSFVPKLIVLVLGLIFLGNWLVAVYIDFFERMLAFAPELLR